MFTGGMVGALVAVLVGLPALRIQGLFLAVTTLAFAFAVEGFILKREFFGWLLPEGRRLHRAPAPLRRASTSSPTVELFGPLTLPPDAKFYWRVPGLPRCSPSAGPVAAPNRSGRILIGARDNGRLVQAFGVNLAATRMAAFAISGFIAGLAGRAARLPEPVFSTPAASPPRSRVELFVMARDRRGRLDRRRHARRGLRGRAAAAARPQRASSSIDLLTSGVGLLILLMFMPGGLIEGVYRVRDNAAPPGRRQARHPRPEPRRRLAPGDEEMPCPTARAS